MSEYIKRKKCACCELPISNMHEVLDLGSVPLAGFFPSEEEKEEDSSFPLKLMYCDRCKLAQTDSVIEPDNLFKDYKHNKDFLQLVHYKIGYKLYNILCE